MRDVGQDDVGHSADKATVFRRLQRASYFLYPLVLPNAAVHKDTFAVCVAEALALGVIVITYKVGALAELYPEGEGIVYLPLPAHADTKALFSNDFASDESLLSDEAVEIMKATILQLHADQKRVISLRARGIQWARGAYSSAKITPLWAQLL